MAIKRKSKFDDFIFYDPKKDELLIGRRDVKWGGSKDWDWFLLDENNKPKCVKGNDVEKEINNKLILVARDKEMSLFP